MYVYVALCRTESFRPNFFLFRYCFRIECGCICMSFCFWPLLPFYFVCMIHTDDDDDDDDSPSIVANPLLISVFCVLCRHCHWRWRLSLSSTLLPLRVAYRTAFILLVFCLCVQCHFVYWWCAGTSAMRNENINEKELVIKKCVEFYYCFSSVFQRKDRRKKRKRINNDWDQTMVLIRLNIVFNNKVCIV